MWFTVTSKYRKFIASHLSIGMTFLKTLYTTEPKHRLNGDRSLSQELVASPSRVRVSDGAWFPGAAVTKDHNSGSLKQQKCIFSLFWRQQSLKSVLLGQSQGLSRVKLLWRL